ncbi:AC5 [Chilli leaf curl virus-India [India:Papaya:2005]]|nr:AC5 [Chilli leaf curl virus-India [India:Papaya:2005]]
MHILHSGSARLFVKHVEHLSKILWFINRTTITDKEKHHTIRVILSLDILIHPYLPQYVHRLNTETLTYSMGEPSTTGNITNTHNLPYMNYIVSRLKRLDLTWAFTTPRNIWASVHPVHPGLPVHGPVHPCSGLCDADSGGSSTAGIRAVEVETAAYLRGGR